ncbi:MAG: adenylate/guanylate cyclase domain-containing protein [Acidimicrobiia bacterium]
MARTVLLTTWPATGSWPCGFRRSSTRALQKHAIAAARRIAHDMKTQLPVGIGVHTGTAYVGVVGEGGAKDFTTLGDAPNTASRLSGSAEAGEIVISHAAAPPRPLTQPV